MNRHHMNFPQFLNLADQMIQGLTRDQLVTMIHDILKDVPVENVLNISEKWNLPE